LSKAGAAVLYRLGRDSRVFGLGPDNGRPEHKSVWSERFWNSAGESEKLPGIWQGRQIKLGQNKTTFPQYFRQRKIPVRQQNLLSGDIGVPVDYGHGAPQTWGTQQEACLSSMAIARFRPTNLKWAIRRAPVEQEKTRRFNSRCFWPQETDEGGAPGVAHNRRQGPPFAGMSRKKWPWIAPGKYLRPRRNRTFNAGRQGNHVMGRTRNPKGGTEVDPNRGAARGSRPRGVGDYTYRTG